MLELVCAKTDIMMMGLINSVKNVSILAKHAIKHPV
jgi:hypothetical protein